MCQAYDKKFNNYSQNTSTITYVEAVASDAGIPVSQIIMIFKGNSAEIEQGTWVHPLVASHLAQWLAPALAVQVNKWVLRFIAGDLTLIGDVTQRYDQIHGTTTTTAVKIEEPGPIEHDLITKRELALLDQMAAATEEKRAAIRERLAAVAVTEATIKRANEESAAAIARADREITVMIKEREAVVAETLVKNQTLGLRLRAEIERINIGNATTALAEAEKYKADAHLAQMFKDLALRSTIYQDALAPAQANPDGAPLPDIPDNNILHNLDISAIAANMGCFGTAKKQLPALGKAIKKEYIRRNGRPPLQVNKLVNGASRPVYVYAQANIPWIEAIIRRMLGLSPVPPTALRR